MIKNILFIERYLEPTNGGIERVTYILAEELRNRGYGTFYAFMGTESDTPLIDDSRKLCMAGCESAQELAEALTAFIRANDIQLMVCQDYFIKKLRIAYPDIVAATGVKLVSCLHLSPDFFEKRRAFSWHFRKDYMRDVRHRITYSILGNRRVRRMRIMYAMSDRFLLLSDRYIPVFARITGIKDTSRLVGMGNPCTFPEAEASPEREKEVLVVGRMLEFQKRISLILRAWRPLAAQHPGWRLRLVGDGIDLDYYKQIARELGLKNIIFEGHSDNVSRYYSKASIFVMTSLFEGLPMTMIEAQSFGCVPVAFDSFAALHDIIDGDNGIIVPDGDMRGLVAAVGSLMNDEDKLRRMAANAMESSRRKFSRDRIIDRWRELIDSL